ncbi:DUF1028 domain-containing protein [Mangrovicoccus ximenensis]|uniref:DUF1028 domain-containing protein n=1 Tax=Mangrovicoccus ximenensis TaxID=1911570 RepID=UPI000D33914F|nr:DUF1028 domain-containing protein [Mangrovicoccus ximenensis]
MTYSIIGLCPDTGMIGGAITTSSPAVGARCLFVESGTGAALSQYWTDPRLGRDALALMAGGLGRKGRSGGLSRGRAALRRGRAVRWRATSLSRRRIAGGRCPAWSGAAPGRHFAHRARP